jgi:hypothetical protein
MPRINPEEVPQQLQKLHDEGVIDLNAPLRNLIPTLEKNFRTNRQRAQSVGYWFVGSKGWFNHPN